MKPVHKGKPIKIFSTYQRAKPSLLRAIGLQCSYCEEPGTPKTLDVEHIYCKVAHPKRAHDWENFLVSCKSCNSYKHVHLGSSVQTNLEGRFLWPHLDNTFLAFRYFPDGRVELAKNLAASAHSQCGIDTLAMCGLMKSPKAALQYQPDIAYDSMRLRKEAWEIAHMQREAYRITKGKISLNKLAKNAKKIGHFSIWMQVFKGVPEVCKVLVKHFKADRKCFDSQFRPISKGRV